MQVQTIARLTHSPYTAVIAATADATQLSTMNRAFQGICFSSTQLMLLGFDCSQKTNTALNNDQW